MYILSAGKSGWFDAENYDGTNIGRFANQKNVIETFMVALEQGDGTKFVHMDWTTVNKYAASQANAHFKVSHNELYVVAQDDILPSGLPTEIFVCYGLTEDYWVPLIASSPSNFPVPLQRMMKVLLTSEGTNWSDEQKERWSGLSLQQIREKFN